MFLSCHTLLCSAIESTSMTPRQEARERRGLILNLVSLSANKRSHRRVPSACRRSRMLTPSSPTSHVQCFCLSSSRHVRHPPAATLGRRIDLPDHGCGRGMLADFVRGNKRREILHYLFAPARFTIHDLKFFKGEYWKTRGWKWRRLPLRELLPRVCPRRVSSR